MTVDSFLNGDFMDAIDDEEDGEDEEVYLIHLPMVFRYPNFILYRHKVTRIWILKETWNQTMTAPLGQ